MDAFGSILGGISSPTGAINMGSLGAAVRPEGKDKESIKRFDSMIDLLGNLGGETPGGLSGYAGEAKAGAFLERNLGSAVTMASTGSGLEEEGGPANQILKQLGAAFERETGQKFEGSIAQKEVAKGLEGKTDDELKAAMADPKKLEGLVGDLQGSLKEVTDTFREAAEMIDNHNAMLAGAYMDQLKLEQEYISSQQSLVDQRFAQKNASAERLGQAGPSNADVQANFMEKQRIAVEGANGIGGLSTDRQAELTAAGGVGDVDAVGATFKNISAELTANNAQIATAANEAGVAPDDLKSATNLADSQKDLIQKNKELQAEYDATKGVLESYANSQERMIKLNKDLSASQQKTKTLKELAISSEYGTAEEKDSANRLLNEIAKVQQSGDLSSAAPEMQKQIIPYLESILGQEEADKIINKGLVAAGKGGEGITEASAETKKIDAEMSAIEEAGIKAGEIMGQEVGMRAETMATAIESLHAKFLTDLKSLLAEDAKQAAQEDKNLATAKGDKAAEQKAIITKAAEQLGMGEGEEAYKKFTQDQAGEDKGAADKRVEALLSGKLSSEAREKSEKQVQFGAGMAAAQKRTGYGNFGDVLDYDNDDVDDFGGKEIAAAFGMSAQDFMDKLEDASSETMGMDEEIGEMDKDEKDAYQELIAGLKKQYTESGMGTEKQFQDLQESTLKNLGGEADTDAKRHLGAMLDAMNSQSKDSKQTIAENKKARATMGITGGGDVDITEAQQRSIQGIKNAADVDKRAAEAQGEITAADTKITSADKSIAEVAVEKDTAAIEKSVREAATKSKFQDTAAKGIAGIDGESIKPVEENTQLAANSLNDLAKHALTQGSLYTHDIHCEVLLQAILSEMTGGESSVAMSGEASALLNGSKEGITEATDGDATAQAMADKITSRMAKGSGGGGGGGGAVGTEGLNDTISRFSKATEELGGVMGNALSVEVGGTIDVNVNMNGADFLKGAQDSIGKYAGQQVSKGINNFITQGLKNNNVKTRPDWVNDGGTNDIPGSSNNESGSV